MNRPCAGLELTNNPVGRVSGLFVLALVGLPDRDDMSILNLSPDLVISNQVGNIHDRVDAPGSAIMNTEKETSHGPYHLAACHVPAWIGRHSPVFFVHEDLRKNLGKGSQRHADLSDVHRRGVFVHLPHSGHCQAGTVLKNGS
jgi:hypothetical protein